MATMIGGFKSTTIESRSKVEPSTVQYIGQYRQGVDSVSQVAYLTVETNSCSAGSTIIAVVVASHSAKKGDVVRFTSGALNQDFAFVQETTPTLITLSQSLVSAPAGGDTFEVLRPTKLKVDSSGALLVNATFSGTPNVNVAQWGGTSTTLGQKLKSASVPVTLASDQDGVSTVAAAIPAKGFQGTLQEAFIGTSSVPTTLTSGGITYLLALTPDAGLQFIDYSSAGEVYSLAASTDGTKTNATYIKLDSNKNVQVVGSIAHDSVDSGNPVKTGGKAASYKPTTSDQPSANKTAVAAADRTDGAFNLFGEAVEGVNPYFFTLDNISTTYNNTTTTATSTAKDCWNYRQASFSYELTRANSPTDILFEVEVSLDGTNYAVMQNDFLGDLRESTASITASGIKKSVTFPIACQSIRIKATATGTTASATFTVTNAKLYLRN